MPGQFVPSPKNRTLRRGGSKVSRTGREESWPLSGPRQIALRAIYRSPPRTSSAPNPVRNILASQFIAAPHNITETQASRFENVPAKRRLRNIDPIRARRRVRLYRPNEVLVCVGGAKQLGQTTVLTPARPSSRPIERARAPARGLRP